MNPTPWGAFRSRHDLLEPLPGRLVVDLAGHGDPVEPRGQHQVPAGDADVRAQRRALGPHALLDDLDDDLLAALEDGFDGRRPHPAVAPAAETAATEPARRPAGPAAGRRGRGPLARRGARSRSRSPRPPRSRRGGGAERRRPRRRRSCSRSPARPTSSAGRAPRPGRRRSPGRLRPGSSRVLVRFAAGRRGGRLGLAAAESVVRAHRVEEELALVLVRRPPLGRAHVLGLVLALVARLRARLLAVGFLLGRRASRFGLASPSSPAAFLASAPAGGRRCFGLASSSVAGRLGGSCAGRLGLDVLGHVSRVGPAGRD